MWVVKQVRRDLTISTFRKITYYKTYGNVSVLFTTSVQWKKWLIVSHSVLTLRNVDRMSIVYFDNSCNGLKSKQQTKPKWLAESCKSDAKTVRHKVTEVIDNSQFTRMVHRDSRSKQPATFLNKRTGSGNNQLRTKCK